MYEDSDVQELLGAVDYVLNDVPEIGEDAQLTAKGYNMLCNAVAKFEGQEDSGIRKINREFRGKCDYCGFHIRFNATFLDQVGSLCVDCPSCRKLISVMAFEETENGR